jgi:hypothetical protein
MANLSTPSFVVELYDRGGGEPPPTKLKKLGFVDGGFGVGLPGTPLAPVIVKSVRYG